ncbi:MAG: hypothetical protein QGH76_00285 [Phycisphaerales bacterium]|jgi:hypothetical protein|nr:hypothetical protein [Phycisphaerales bacterium]
MMNRTLSISACTGVLALASHAGQQGPWDNVLEAVLFATTPTDLDGNGETDVTDLLLLVSEWGTCSNCVSDIDQNGVVDVTDLLSLIKAWGPNEVSDLDEMDVPQAGVPCFSLGPGGELIQMFQWFPNGDSSINFIARRVSTDMGLTWSEIQGIQWTGGPAKHSTQADPSLVWSEDESVWRLYFTCDLDAEGPGWPKTYSAVSDNGLHFAWEDWKTPRMSLEDAGLLDPSVIFFHGEYHYFAPVPGQSYGSIYATSSDGVTFQRQDDLIVDGRDDTKFLGNPAIVDDKLYFFGTLEPSGGNTWGGIFYAESDDAINWTVLYEEWGDVADPAGIQVDSGLLVFKTALYQ